MTPRMVWMAAAAGLIGLVGVIGWALTDDGDDGGTSMVADSAFLDDTTAPTDVVTPPDADPATPGPVSSPDPDATPSAVPPTPGPVATEAPEPTGTPVPTPDSGPLDTTGWSRCTNPVFGWEISYPPEWSLYSDEDGTYDCALFAPDDISDLDIDLAFMEAHIFVGLFEDGDLASYRDEFIDHDDWESPPTVEDISAAGRPALLYAGVIPAGLIDDQPWGVKEYVVDVTHLSTPGVLFVEVFVPFDERFDEATLVLDAMITTLSLPPS